MRSSFRLLSALFLALVCATAATAFPAPAVTPLHVENGRFVLDGKPIQIVSGEMHYPRIPRAEWRNRMRLAKAMGLNAITTYVFWNEHELQPGVYDFSGQRDVAEFIREAQSEGLHVILRPGPYVCAEWEWGGYPSWLLKQPGIVVRSSDPKFMEPVHRWLLRLGQELAPLQAANGGPIFAVQVENEYGSFGADHAYMNQIRQTLIEAGFGRSLLYTADGPPQIPDGSLPDLPAVINFGPGEASKSFAELKRQLPAGPFMSGEYWAGWFDHWGEPHHVTDARKEADEVGWILSQGYSISIYMFHGGTSFGWMNGANMDRGKYQPDTTSYDYDAPLDESGRPTKKYELLRAAIAKATGIAPPPVPIVPPAQSIPAFALNSSVPLAEALPAPIESQQVASMEDLGQAYGYILYRTEIAAPVKGELVLDELHDYARVYANGRLLGSLDRRLGQNRLAIDLPEPQTRLEILVENSGRVNFTTALRNERKGITHRVLLAGKPLTGWQIFSLPMEHPEQLNFHAAACSGPCFYRGSFQVDRAADTYLDTSAWSKGFVWVNGHALGRIWNVGPQQSLYLPGSWLRSGSNEVVVFDLDGASGRTLQGIPAPRWGAGQPHHAD